MREEATANDTNGRQLRQGSLTSRIVAYKDVDETALRILVQAIAERRDRTAFSELFRYFAPRLKSFAMRAGADAAAAEEVVQETMIQIWRRADTYNGAKSNVSTWIYTIARNRRIDALRREARPDSHPAEVASPGNEAQAEETGESAYLASEAERLLHQAIEELPSEQASVLRMMYFEDKSHSAISAEKGISLGTVKSRARLALARLRVLTARLNT